MCADATVRIAYEKNRLCSVSNIIAGLPTHASVKTHDDDPDLPTLTHTFAHCFHMELVHIDSQYITSLNLGLNKNRLPLLKNALSNRKAYHNLKALQ